MPIKKLYEEIHRIKKIHELDGCINDMFNDLISYIDKTYGKIKLCNVCGTSDNRIKIQNLRNNTDNLVICEKCYAEHFKCFAIVCFECEKIVDKKSLYWDNKNRGLCDTCMEKHLYSELNLDEESFPINELPGRSIYQYMCENDMKICPQCKKKWYLPKGEELMSCLQCDWEIDFIEDDIREMKVDNIKAEVNDN